MPETTIPDITDLLLVDLLQTCGLTASRGEGRRLIKQGGISVNGEKVTDEFMPIDETCFDGGILMLKKGKKVFHKVILSQ
jgi:tyrosyl-tRNA synthetase